MLLRGRLSIFGIQNQHGLNTQMWWVQTDGELCQQMYLRIVLFIRHSALESLWTLILFTETTDDMHTSCLRSEATHKGVNQRLKDATQAQQQRPESHTVTFSPGIWVNKCKVHKPGPRSVSESELRSCVKGEKAVLDSLSLTVLKVSVDVKQHCIWTMSDISGQSERQRTALL